MRPERRLQVRASSGRSATAARRCKMPAASGKSRGFGGRAPFNKRSPLVLVFRFATAFFRKAMKHHGEPRTITLDGFEPSHSALRCMGMRNEFNYRWENPVKIRSCQYLNNIVEIVFTQMTKTRGLTPGMGWNHVADLNFIVAHNHAVDQQFHQSPLLLETSMG